MGLSAACLGACEKRCLYAGMNRVYLNMEAIFSDETANFVTPYDPDPGESFAIRLRTAKDDADAVFLHCGEKKLTMTKADTDRLFDYYAVQLTAGDMPLRYYFSVQKNDRVYYYNKRGLYDTANPDYHFCVVPGFRTPDWAKGAVMYQIFVDRFYNGDPGNDVADYEYIYLGKPARAVPWDRSVATEDVCNFYGGDLRGVMDKMAYLKDLGVEAIYLNPIFVSPSNHKYDVQDYDYVDPHYGTILCDEGECLRFERFHNRFATKYKSRTTNPVNLEASNQLLAELIALAHRHNIKVILDGVFNHCGSYNKWMDKGGFYAGADYPPGAYREENSPYHDYFLWYDRNWPNNDCYDGWWGNENHPKLNYESAPALRAYMLEIAKKWVSPPYNADGWRLDVAADLGRSPAFNHGFWRDFRTAVKSANPQAVILAEHYGDASPWLMGGEWDTVMNYDAFMEPITWFLTGMNKHSEESKPSLYCDAMAFENAMRFYMARFNVHALHMAMNELSNHDHSRFLTRTNRSVGRLHTVGAKAADEGIRLDVMMEAVVFQMTWPGAPTVYYGDEAGLTGWTDPDNRRPFPWGREHQTLLSLHRRMIALRKKHSALRHGSLEFLFNDYGIISYGRWDSREGFAVVLNNNETPKTLSLPVWKIGRVEGRMRCLVATANGTVFDAPPDAPPDYPVNGGAVVVTVPACGSLVLA